MNTPCFLPRRSALKTLGATALAATAPGAFAQAGPWPNRPVKVIVPWAVGGGGDVLVRLMAPSLSARLGQQFIVENRPGAIGTIGSSAAARSPADGYTFVYGAADSHSIAPHIMKAPYDSKKDFVAVAPIGFPPLGLVVHASHPAKSFAQFVELARSAKEPMTFGSWGKGSSGHITMEALKQSTRIDLLHVPYNGTAPLVQAQLVNEVNCSINTMPVVEQHVRAGALRVLAITARERLAEFPDVPIMKEFGVAIDMGPWLGILAPAGVPADVVAKLNAAIDATMAEPKIVEAMRRQIMIIDRMDPRAYQSFYESEYDRWGQYIRTAKVSLE